MLVYGDIERTEDPRDKLAGLARSLEHLPGAAGIERHGALVVAFIEASELAQGLADAEFEVRGEDAASPVQEAATALLMALAHGVVRSWRSGFAQGELRLDGAFERLHALALPATIRTKRAEGYAFYALYPESYAEAARRIAGPGPFVVIGIRSIGIGLAAVVSASLGAAPPISLRPIGDPFGRGIAASSELSAQAVADEQARFLIVDEGPGLSGSSFGAVADWLEENGIARERIAFLPSHAGDLGPQASEPHRERWSKASRHVLAFDDLAIRPSQPAHRLESWVADLCGGPRGPLHDISGGNWRSLVYDSEAQWPAANVQQERRKFLLRSDSGPWLVKFAGLGSDSGQKLARARALHTAGFTPEALAVRHGFLVERWLEHAAPLGIAQVEREHLFDTLARYLGFRARTFPAADRSGASLQMLLTMARRNTALALGAEAAAGLDRWAPEVERLEARVVRVDTDNRLQPAEWLVSPDGRLLKTDALDHSAAHDLVGCQDIAWDVAGAAVEFGLDEAEEVALRERVARESGRPVDPDLVVFGRLAYLAFQVGAQSLAAQALMGWPAEAERLKRSEAGYRDLLARELLRS